jgi:hypothetical protein
MVEMMTVVVVVVAMTHGASLDQMVQVIVVVHSHHPFRVVEKGYIQNLIDCEIAGLWDAWAEAAVVVAAHWAQSPSKPHLNCY